MNVHEPLTRNKLSAKEHFEVSVTLHKHCKSVDGYAVYDEGWNDARIAKELDVTVPNVGYVRRNVFGNFKQLPRLAVRSYASKATLEQRIADLEDTVTKLIAALGGNL